MAGPAKLPQHPLPGYTGLPSFPENRAGSASRTRMASGEEARTVPGHLARLASIGQSREKSLGILSGELPDVTGAAGPTPVPGSRESPRARVHSSSRPAGGPVGCHCRLALPSPSALARMCGFVNCRVGVWARLRERNRRALRVAARVCRANYPASLEMRGYGRIV